jgi:serine/threonine protein kinase
MIPNIVIGDRLGGGAFGDVHRGFHQVLAVPVAIKIVRRGLADGDGDAALNEARLMARLDHPNLLRIFDAGRTSDGLLYLVLELMDGTCAGQHRLDPAAASQILRQLLAGLQALHEARILHRDIKPANILRRTSDGRMKLADLGIAIPHATQPRADVSLAGTMPFMAPELFTRSTGFAPRTDLYALGVTMQCLLLDENPYPTASTAAIMNWVLGGPPSRIVDQRPDLPRELGALVDDLSARAPATRPASAADALARLSPGSSARVRRPTAPALDTPTIGAWVLGAEVPRDGNFREFVVSHAQTGAAGRLAWLKPRCPLQHASPLIVASAQRASRLQHGGIVDVIDWGLHEERAFVVTRSQGRSLMEVVEASGPLTELDAVTMALGLADALVYLHAAGLVYQVIHPGLVVLAADARTAQLAWPRFCQPIGASAHPEPGTTLTITVPRFAAPESLVRPSRTQAPPVDPDAETVRHRPPASVGRYEVVADMSPPPAQGLVHPTLDLYGLGETLYYLLAGAPAYSDTPDVLALVLEKMRGPARIRTVAPAVTGPTAQLIADLTAPMPADRPPSALAVRDELARIAARLG